MLDGVLLRNIQLLRSERKSGKDSQRTPLPRLYYRTNVLLSQEGNRKNHTSYTFNTSSPKWLITFTAILPVFGFSKG